MDSKICKKCLQDLPLDVFPKNTKGAKGRGQRCNKCSALIAADYRNNNHNIVYANKFKTTPQIISIVLEKKLCEICGCLSLHKRHNIDHNHQTGKIRGLLCDDCNIGIGKFKDDIGLIQKAINYLKRTND